MVSMFHVRVVYRAKLNLLHLRVLTARCYASAVYADTWCASVCPSVPHKLVFYQNDCMHHHTINNTW